MAGEYLPNAVAVPTSNPGELYIPALGQYIQQVELREDDVFDTIQLVAGAINAGTKQQFFQNLQDKNEQHTNMPQPRRIAAGDEVAVYRIGLQTRDAAGNVTPAPGDVRKVFGNARLQVKFNKRVIADGPAIKYPSGYGLSGSLDASAAADGVLSNGVPSVAASPTLFVPQQLTTADDIYAILDFPDAAWVTGYAVPTTTALMLLTLYLRGVIKSPLGK